LARRSQAPLGWRTWRRGDRVAWTVDDSYKVNIGEEAPAGQAKAGFWLVDVTPKSDRFNVDVGIENVGDARGDLFWLLYDRDRGSVVQALNGQKVANFNLGPGKRARLDWNYGYNFPDSGWRLAVYAGHEENGKLVVDNAVGFKLTK